MTALTFVDASHSLYFTIDAVDPRVTYETASGYSYLTQPAVPDTVPVTIAIKPDGRMIDAPPVLRNPINLGSKGLLPVALLSTTGPAFDAKAIATASLTIGDPKLTGRVHPVKFSYADIDGDGDIDCMMQFNMQELVAVGALNAATKDLMLTGQFPNGTHFAGFDHIFIVK